jgi:hypothetical protein
MKVPISTRIDKRLKKRLDDLSKRSRVPQTSLVEEALELFFSVHTGNPVTPQFREMVDRYIEKNRKALKDLAK